MRRKKLTSLFAIGLSMVMMLTACGSSGTASGTAGDEADASTVQTGSGQEETGNEAEESDNEGSDTTYTIGFNNYLKGIYSLDILEKNFLTTCEALGVEPMVVNDEGKVENCVTNVDNMIAAGVDGIVFFGISDTLFPVVAQKCEEAGIPYAFFDHMPSDDILSQIQGNENYAGIAATVDTYTGNNIGEYAAEAGLKKAIVVTGETTDTTHSARTNGFKEKFEAAGGKVLAEGYGTVTISDAMQRANDLLTAHPDVDCVYATNGDVGVATIEALAKHPEVNAKLYVTDLDPDILTGLEEGTIAAANGAHWVNIDYATALLVNKLNGHGITNEDGTPARLVVPVMTLPNNYVDLYNSQWIEKSPYSTEEIQSLVGNDISIDDFNAMLEDYTIENRLQAKLDAGEITQEEFDAAKDK